MTSCHVLKKPKSGPVTPQAMMTAHAMTNAIELPDHAVARCEKPLQHVARLVERFPRHTPPLAEPGPRNGF